MSETSDTVVQVSRERLKFIDMARSVAILLMLEGHFIDETLKVSYRVPENFAYTAWHFVRGFTAPLFFTVTGLIFVYLLTKHKEVPYWENKRVRKGYRRAFELLFWGYFLQTYIFGYIGYLMGNITENVYEFHVLQSIGCAIIIILLIYRLYTWLHVGPLWLYYFLTGIIVLSFYPYLMSFPRDVHFPEGWPRFIQNMVHGPRSHFPLSPWIAFSMFGAMFGVLLNKYGDRVRQNWFPLTIIGIGFALNIISIGSLELLDKYLYHYLADKNIYLSSMEWVFSRFGQVLIGLGILMFIDKYLNIKENLFIKIGQSTLQIFIVHFIILYGGIFGFRLNSFFSKNLEPYQAIIGAVLFIGLFVVFTKYLVHLTIWYHKFLDVIFAPLQFLKRKILKK
jgi:uncharacterized membrane protein